MMETVSELETKAFLEIAELIENQKKQIQQLQERLHYLEAQVYGGHTK